MEKSFDELFRTTSLQLKNDLEVLGKVVSSELPIFIQGETGTGKTYLARRIHEVSKRSGGPFVALNCSEISKDLIDSELFGHTRGAFSGAVNSRRGKLELAHGGTLFLDELGSMSLLTQAKLLKAIEEKSFYPLGAERSVTSDFRVLSATCEDLRKKVRSGEFREDLYFRLYGHSLTIPPLRQRREDIELYLNHCLLTEVENLEVDDLAMEKLLNYDWPGNTRELERFAQKVKLVNKNGILTTDCLPEYIQKNAHPLDEERETCSSGAKIGKEGQELDSLLKKAKNIGMKNLMREIEQQVVAVALELNSGHIRKTMSELRMSNSSFYRVLDRINVNE